VPSLEQVHKGALSAKKYMTGSFTADLMDQKQSVKNESISTPVDFLMPEVITNSFMGK
jgi:hypothetical protein